MENVKKGLRRGSLPWLVDGLQDRQAGLSVGSGPGTGPFYLSVGQDPCQWASRKQ